MFRRIIPVVCLLMLIAACAPVISQTTMGTVDKSISFAALQQNPDAYKDKIVLLGGQIITTTVRENETWIEVLEKKLDYKQKPEDTDQSAGRFLVRFAGFLDPAIYASGRTLTVAGQVEGKVVRPINETKYTFPVLIAKEHYLWKPEQANGGPRFGIGIGGGVGSHGSGGGVGVGVGF
ncbi:MAG: Slp family lipoprotein [Syntrophaceae bacterium]|nr:Slp family lipoprotein [Syntrophaceae bacterium]